MHWSKSSPRRLPCFVKQDQSMGRLPFLFLSFFFFKSSPFFKIKVVQLFQSKPLQVFSKCFCAVVRTVYKLTETDGSDLHSWLHFKTLLQLFYSLAFIHFGWWVTITMRIKPPLIIFLAPTQPQSPQSAEAQPDVCNWWESLNYTARSRYPWVRKIKMEWTSLLAKSDVLFHSGHVAEDRSFIYLFVQVI